MLIKSSILRIMLVASVADLMTCCLHAQRLNDNFVAHVDDFACGNVDAEGFAVGFFMFGAESYHNVYGV